MAEEIADQLSVIAHLARAVAVADAGCLNDGSIVPHDVDQGDVTVVENLELLPAEGVDESVAIGARGLHGGA
jgi:hypothetical protein